jgi:GTP-binding protein HflX
VTNEILQSLGCGDRPVIPVLNKWDLVRRPGRSALHVPGAVRISALKNEGIPKRFCRRLKTTCR